MCLAYYLSFIQYTITVYVWNTCMHNADNGYSVESQAVLKIRNPAFLRGNADVS